MMQIWINKKNKLLKKSAYGAIDGFMFGFSSALTSDVVVAVWFPEAFVVDVWFPEASVVDVWFPEASVEDDENNENDSKFGENNSLILVVPPNNDECMIKNYIQIMLLKNTYYNIIIN
jgi:hypothetical protein